MAVAMPVRSRKQSDSPAATLYSPPETWTSKDRALRKGTTPGSRRWTSAPRARKSRAHGSLRIGSPLMAALLNRHGREAAVHNDVLAGDERRGPRRRQPDDRSGELVRLAEASH